MGFPITSNGLYMFFGKKGAGKSCTLAKIAKKALKKGYFVYSTVPIKHTFYFDAHNFGKFEFEPHSVVLIDEANTVWDNRDFRQFPKYTQDLFRYQRHFDITVFLFSQTWDVDKKLKDLCDGLYLVKRLGKYFAWIKTIDKEFIVTKSTDYGGSDITFGLSIRPFIIGGSRHIVFFPLYWNMYDSFSKYKLEDVNSYVDYIA